MIHMLVIAIHQTLTPDCHKHSKSHSALIVKQVADLYGYKQIVYI